MDAKAQQLIDRLLVLVNETTGALQLEFGTDPLLVDAWQDVLEQLLTRYHTAALMTGLGTLELSPKAIAEAKKIVRVQLGFLERFALEVQQEAEWQAGWNSRARLYAEAIGQSYEAGTTRLLPLPALPRDGTTQCLTNCLCSWEIVTVDDTAGDYDCYWRLAGKEHCQTCVARATRWSPLRIRGGRLVRSV